MNESSSLNKLIIIKPDDWHLHLRNGEILKSVLPETSKWAGRAIIMPNLVPPVLTTDDAKSYLEEINSNIPENHNFVPLMTLYLNDQTNKEDIINGHKENIIKGIKFYPSGATTNSSKGVKKIENVFPILETIAKIGIPLLIHGEVTESEIDIFDREAVFIERVLEPIRNSFPDLRIVFEHITTIEAVKYVSSSQSNLSATITPHHLIINRNSYLAGGIKPDYYCLPIAKKEIHRLALVKAAISGSEKFFLGTDSAPHLEKDKISECGCAGIFNAPNTLPCLAQVFENENSLKNLENFTSINGANFYKLPVNNSKITLVKNKHPTKFKNHLLTSRGKIKIFDPKMEIFWTIK